MRAKQISGLFIFVVVLNICVNAQFLNFNTVSHNRGAQQQSNGRASRQQTFVVQQPQQQQQTRRQRPTQDSQIDTIIIVETEAETPKGKPTQRQPQRQQTQNQRPAQQNQAKASQRQQTTNQHAQQSHRHSNPTQDSQTDTIIIIQTEAETPKVKPTQRQQRHQTAQNNIVNQQTQVQQTQRQPQRQQNQNQNQRPNQQNQAKAPQRQQTTNQQAQQNHRVTQQNSAQSTQRQPQRQQTQSQPQTQQNSRTTRQPQIQQHQQQQYQQQTQIQHQRPTHEDAPVIFPGSTNNPHRTTEPSLTFSRPSNQFSAPTTAISPASQALVGNSENLANNNFNSFGGGFNNANQAGFVPDNSFGASVGVGAVSDGFGGNNFNGNGINNFDNNQFFTGPTNSFDNNNSPVNNFDNGFVGAGVGGGGGPYDDNRWNNPHRPHGNYYRNFAPIFNDIDRKAENDYNTSEEDDEVNDDFNGRSVVSPGQYPHMAALGYRTSSGDTEFKCGGSLISEMFVLTAAHCCFLNGQAPHLVKIGDIKLKEFEGDIVPQRRGIAKIHEHPFYNTSMHYHDIGLLELANPIEYTYFVRPIRLWASDEIPYSKVFTMGYGSTSFAQAPTNVLTELDLTIVPLETCNQSMPRDPNAPHGIIESQICAKDFEKNRDTCQGDSGGPLQLNLQRPRRRRLRYYLVGVISYGTFCRSRYPGVYTRVSSYIDWIASIVWPAYLNRFQEY